MNKELIIHLTIGAGAVAVIYWLWKSYTQNTPTSTASNWSQLGTTVSGDINAGNTAVSGTLLNDAQNPGAWSFSTLFPLLGTF